jgi:tRNA(Ile2) C34 agmatinyltransferase TiaS
METFAGNTYHEPKECEVCKGKMVFKGVGEYACEDCGAIAYDDYGKVRIFLEKHPRSNAQDAETATGVAGRIIRQMLRDEKLEVAPDSKVFLRCEGCGVNIRSGLFCAKCEVQYRQMTEEKAKQRKSKAFQGFGMDRPKGEEGERRYLKWNK